MHPLYDPESQLIIYNHLLKRLEDESHAGNSFVGTLIAAVVAMAATPVVLWLIATGLGLGPTV